jgi:hypothetical protein
MRAVPAGATRELRLYIESANLTDRLFDKAIANTLTCSFERYWRITDKLERRANRRAAAVNREGIVR